jgi:uncharacterized protein YbjT (DUF2867 family)
MKYVITGGAGHTSGLIAEKLLAAGKDVTVVGRNAEHLKPLADKGAKTAIGTLEDEQFLKQTLADADVVYTLIPPNYATDNFRAYQQKVGSNFYNALKESKVKHLVNLSSAGAHAKDKVGVVNGLADFELLLNTLTNVNVKHLRPVSFYYNFFSQIPTIKAYGIMGSNYKGDVLLPLVDPADIADVAAEELSALSFTGKSVRYIASEETTPNEVATLLGAAIGKPDLKWAFVPDAQLKAGMLQGGLKETMADGFIEMGQAVEAGIFVEDYLQHKPVLGSRKLKAFAQAFAAAYNAPGQPAGH